MAYDPFSDDQPAPKTTTTETGGSPVVDQGDNWVSFSFNSAAGYDRIGATVHGSPEFVAKTFGITDFNGKVSSLMKQAVKVDEYFKKQYGGGEAPGKA